MLNKNVMVIRVMINKVGSFCLSVVEVIIRGLINVVIFSISVMLVIFEFKVLLMVVFILLLVDVIVEIIIFGVEDFIVIIVRFIIMGEILMFLVRVDVLYIKWLVF